MINPMDEDIKRITCFLPKGEGVRLVELLHWEKDINSTNVHTGRGLRTVENVDDHGAWSEQDVLTVTIEAERADEIFEYIFFQGELNKPGGGFIYQTSLARASIYTLPSIEG